MTRRAELSNLQGEPEVEDYWSSRGQDYATSSSVPQHHGLTQARDHALLQHSGIARSTEPSNLQDEPEVQHHWSSRGRDYSTSSSVPQHRGLTQAGDHAPSQHSGIARSTELSNLQGESEVEHFWSSRGRDRATSSSVPYAAPRNFSVGPSWVWKNDLNEQVRFSPLIDAGNNIYIITTTRIRKFSSSGYLRWTWQTDSNLSMNVCPVLHGSFILTLLALASNDYKDPALVSIGMKSGVETWRRVVKGRRSSGDAKGLRVYNGTVYFGLRTNTDVGSDTVVAMSALDGESMWDYVTDSVCWNLSPAAVDDGGLVFSGACGTVFRLSAGGRLLWRAGPGHPRTLCGHAGGALGPNGLFYAAYNGAGDSPVSKLAAYRVTDGLLVWQRTLEYRAAQYPAVGKLGPEGPLAVLVPMGDQPMPPASMLVEAFTIIRHGPYRSMVLALDAETGATLWQSKGRPWHSIHSAGELGEHNATDGRLCRPEAQGIPVVAGDGTVYASSGHHGDLTAIRDENGDGIIGPGEVSTFRTRKCFLNSPSIAPGMLVAAPCWGPVYLFKS